MKLLTESRSVVALKVEQPTMTQKTDPFNYLMQIKSTLVTLIKYFAESLSPVEIKQLKEAFLSVDRMTKSRAGSAPTTASVEEFHAALKAALGQA